MVSRYIHCMHAYCRFFPYRNESFGVAISREYIISRPFTMYVYTSGSISKEYFRMKLTVVILTTTYVL